MIMKKVGLALGSGGARGLAHLGVLKVLEKNNIPIDFIAGTSVGALIGGLYAFYRDTKKLEDLINEFSYRDLITIFANIDFRVKGLIKGDHAINFLRSIIGDAKIEDLKIPFKAVATNVNTGEVTIFDKGDLIDAIRASGSVPIIFRPFQMNKNYFVDGGISMPVPVQVTKQMGAEFTIAVTLDKIYVFDKKAQKNIPRINAYTIAVKSLNLLRYYLAQENIKEADIVIAPEVSNGSWLNFVHSKEIIKIGEESCFKALPFIKEKLYL